MAGNSSSLDFVRNKGGIESHSNVGGNFTSLEVKLKNFPSQTITVAEYRKNSKDEKEPLITIRKTIKEKDENGSEKERTVEVARFYNVKGEGDQIFMDILDPTLKKTYTDTISQKEKDAFPNRDFSSGIAISGLELDKKMDIRVKGLGKDMGMLFSAFGFQLRKTAEKEEESINKVFKNEDSPYDIEISENFIDKAITNELEEKKNGCLLSESMSITSPEMQGLLRSSLLNDGIGASSEKSFANGRVKLEQITFNDGEKKRPLSFMKIDGKPYVYASLVSSDSLIDDGTEKGGRKTELAGRFYELTNFSDDKIFGNNIRLELFDKNLRTLDGAYPHTRTAEIPILNENGESKKLLDYLNKIAKDKEFDKDKIQAVPNTTLSNETYGQAERTYGEAKIYDSAGFVRNEKVEGAFEDSNSAEFVAQMSGGNAQNVSATQENGGAENGKADENVFFSANSPQEQNEETTDEKDKQSKQGEQEKSDKEKEKQDATAEAAPQDAPPPPPPATGNNEEQKEENKEDKSETGNTIFDQPFLENKEKESFSPDASNKLAATLGITFTGIGMLLAALACFLGPLVGFIGCTVCFGLATVSLMKPWELRTGKSKDIIDKNLALVKERQKELERERKADLEGQKNAQKEAKKAENKSKNQKQIDKLNKENEELKKREQELGEHDQVLSMLAATVMGLGGEGLKFEGYNVDKNGKLIFPEDSNLSPEEKANLQKKYDETTEMSNAQISAPGGRLADYDVDENGNLIFPKDSNLSPEEKAELQKEYDEIIEISKQNEKEIGLTREEREQNHFNDYTKTVDELDEINAKLDEINKSGNESNNLPNEDEISDEHAREVIERDEEIGSLKKQKEELENRLAYQRDIVQNDIFAKMQRTQAGLTKEEAEKTLTSDQRMAVYNHIKAIREAIGGEKRQIKKLIETNNNIIVGVEKKAEIDHSREFEVATKSSRGYSEFLEKSYGDLDEQQKVTEAYAKNVSDERERYRILTDSIMKKMEEIEKLPKDQRDEEYAKMNLILSSLKRSAFDENIKACEQLHINACEQLLGTLKNSSAEKEEKSSNSQSASENGKKEEKSSNPTPASNKEGNEMGNSK